MDFIRKLPIPKEIKAQFPLSAQTARIKEARDAEMKRIFTGESDKFILVIVLVPQTAKMRYWIMSHVLQRYKKRSRINSF